MTAKTFLLAAALLATTTFNSGAQAGGIRLSMGGPLGNFTAHPHLSSGPGGTGAKRHSSPHCRPRAIARSTHEEPPVHHAYRAAPKVEVAEEAPAPRKSKRQPKPDVQDDAPPVTVAKAKPVAVEKPVEVQTAKLEDKAIVSDAAPAIFIPDSPAMTAQLQGTQSTPAPLKTAALGPAVSSYSAALDKPAVNVEPLKTGEATKPAEVKPAVAEKTAKVEKAEPKKAGTASSVSKLCRKFSAAVADLITVPCGE